MEKKKSWSELEEENLQSLALFEGHAQGKMLQEQHRDAGTRAKDAESLVHSLGADKSRRPPPPRLLTGGQGTGGASVPRPWGWAPGSTATVCPSTLDSSLIGVGFLVLGGTG